MTDKENTTADYEVTQAREVAGQYRQVGDTVALTKRQAQYYLPPHGAGLVLAGQNGKRTKAVTDTTKDAPATAG